MVEIVDRLAQLAWLSMMIEQPSTYESVLESPDQVLGCFPDHQFAL
jgi:hypothetical protein